MSDVVHLWVKGGIPSVYFGPGRLEQCHVADEYIETAEIVRGARIFTALAMNVLAPGVDKAPVLASIEADEVIALARSLVQVPSENPPGSEARVSALLEDHLGRLGLEVRTTGAIEGRPAVLADLRGAGPGPVLLFNGHTDVVPAGPGWTVPPYDGVLADGRLYGRGACDMKGGLASILAVAQALRRNDVPLNGTLRYALVPDEEAGGTVGAGYLVERGLLAADMAVVAEPSDFEMNVSEGGMLWLEITTHGTRTHTLNRLSAVNAVEDMALVITRLKSLGSELTQAAKEDAGAVLVTTNMVEGGLKVNVVPDSCKAMVDFRFAPGSSVAPQDAVGAVEAILGELRAGTPGFAADIDFTAKEGFVQPRDTRIVHEIIRAMEEVEGRTPGWWH